MKISNIAKASEVVGFLFGLVNVLKESENPEIAELSTKMANTLRDVIEDEAKMYDTKKADDNKNNDKGKTNLKKELKTDSKVGR